MGSLIGRKKDGPFDAFKEFSSVAQRSLARLSDFGFAIVVSIFWEVYFCEGWETIYRGLIRFFRITLFLCFPLYLLSPVYSKLGVILRLRTGVLIQIVAKQKTEMHLEEMYTA